MCGIIGIATNSRNSDPGWLILGRDTMRHRGPDGSGLWWSQDGRVGFGHRRLAILDISSAGHQPMHDVSNTLTIIFNGEIYNFRDLQQELIVLGHHFRSHSDTEVLLASYREWGVDCLSRLNGMFAFAIYDTTSQTLFIARDRAGEKPLFYSMEDGKFRFASELKGLLADKTTSRSIDHQALDTYLAVGYIPGDRCIVRGVNKLPPAHALIFNLSNNYLKIWRYWNPPSPVESISGIFDENILLDEFELLLEDAVRRQLIADVPVGVLLSGGVDSSLITAMAVRIASDVKTFTVGFKGFSSYDETEHARLIAKYFGTNHVELDAGEANPELMPMLARQFDEPMADSSMIPTYMVSHLVKQHCTVALGGDGGDELFGGYAHYDRLLRKRHAIRYIPMLFRNVAAYCAGEFLPAGFRGRHWLRSLGDDLERGLPLSATFFDGKQRRELLGNGDWPLVAEGIWGLNAAMDGDLLQRMTRMDFQNYMVEDILVKIDRASMLNSLELRAPFLDYRIIEFAFARVPSQMKATLNQRKIFLKKLTANILPPDFDKNRKQGFSVPLNSWLNQGPWRQAFQDVLFDSKCIFNKEMVKGLFYGQDQGRNNSERLFSLYLFELWRREYGMAL
ncbi:asparagine synthase (glutamine-hydrolyzing) [Polynucleobacter ibericus]|uniref:asparagine synthase (glutamine-hydrolyzing) n=1 Tax=Polynucleobacter ibericus TaxID=1819725 RepID=UPI001BFDD9EB|nr:asparagine synthase (glutamine-hydrolyzing) [Polynucleobacter ibericus]QWE08968.1 asparagine synthase (glutamine-hydrolyzing) [Polynucleobacter ibericus]